MSAQQLPSIQQLEQQVHKEAVRMSARFKESDLPDADTNQQREKEVPTEEKPAEVKLNIPTQAVPAIKPNIFSQRPVSGEQINIFGNSKSVNLFSLSQQNGSQQPLNIFANAMTTPPAIGINEVDDLSENSQGSDRGHQELKEPTEMVMKYNYEPQFEKLVEFRLCKFRAGVGAVKEGVIVSLEKEINKSEKVLFLVLRSETTKVVVYNGFLLLGVKAQTFMNKKENLKLTVLKLSQEEKKHENREERNQENREEGNQESKEETKEQLSEEQKKEVERQDVNEGEKKQEKQEDKQEVKQEVKKESHVRHEREQVKLQFEKEEDARSFEEVLTEFFKEK